jgi:hypothetical protein
MASLFTDRHDGDWRQRLGAIVELVRDMSRQTDPQEMVRSDGEKVRLLLPSDRRISLSRRGPTTPPPTTSPGTAPSWRSRCSTRASP